MAKISEDTLHANAINTSSEGNDRNLYLFSFQCILHTEFKYDSESLDYELLKIKASQRNFILQNTTALQYFWHASYMINSFSKVISNIFLNTQLLIFFRSSFGTLYSNDVMI